jgi:hypothetical protein
MYGSRMIRGKCLWIVGLPSRERSSDRCGDGMGFKLRLDGKPYLSLRARRSCRARCACDERPRRCNAVNSCDFVKSTVGLFRPSVLEAQRAVPRLVLRHARLSASDGITGPTDSVVSRFSRCLKYRKVGSHDLTPRFSRRSTEFHFCYLERIALQDTIEDPKCLGRNSKLSRDGSLVGLDV